MSIMVKLDKRYGYLLIYIMLFTLASVAIPSPIPILEWTRTLYEYVDALPPRSLILVSSQYGTPGPTFEPFAHAFLYHALKNDLRLVMVGPALAVVHWNDLILRGTGWFDTKEYGVDFVKEDGEWKFWHTRVYYIFRTPYYESWVDRKPIPELDGQVLRVADRKQTRPTTYHWEYTNVSNVENVPEPPLPYKTWDGKSVADVSRDIPF